MKESTKSNTEESPSYFMGLFCIFAFIVFIITISCAVTQMNISIANKKRETRQLKHIAYWQTQRPELQPLIIKAKKDGKITQEEYDRRMKKIKDKMQKKGERKTGLFDKIKEIIDYLKNWKGEVPPDEVIKTVIQKLEQLRVGKTTIPPDEITDLEPLD